MMMMMLMRRKQADDVDDDDKMRMVMTKLRELELGLPPPPPSKPLPVGECNWLDLIWTGNHMLLFDDYPTEIGFEQLIHPKFRAMVESRKPERYSSAAPLAPNARQRIVSERVDIINNLVISVLIGPPNSRFLTSNAKKTWTAKDVADSVLSAKSALPVSTDQRMIESSVLDANSSEVDGEPYWYYEYLVRKSPTQSSPMGTMCFPETMPFLRSAGFLISCMDNEIRDALNYEFAKGFTKPPFKNHDFNCKLDNALTNVFKS